MSSTTATNETRVVFIRGVLESMIKKAEALPPTFRRKELREIKKLWVAMEVGFQPLELREEALGEDQ